MIIGITGTLGAGKGTVVEYIKEEKGFNHYSVRAFITEEIVRREMPVNRDSMVEVANDLRATHGPAYCADALYMKAVQDGGNAIIESLRAPAEVEALKKKDSFVLLAVNADRHTRYDRIRKRGIESDNVSFEKFVADEEREMANDDPTKQNIRAVMEMADYHISNDGTIEELNKQIDDIITKIESAST